MKDLEANLHVRGCARCRGECECKVGNHRLTPVREEVEMTKIRTVGLVVNWLAGEGHGC